MKTQNIFRALTVLAIALSAVALYTSAVSTPATSTTPISSQSVPPCSLAPGGVAFLASSGCTISMTTGSKLTADSGVNVTVNAITATTLSGPVRYGTASNVISGTTIAHGLGTTPTMFLIQNAVIQGTTYSQTLYGYSCGAISCTVGVSNGAVVTFTSAVWASGR